MTSLNQRVYWDGYGLGPNPSGVAVYANSIRHELVKIGVDPVLVGDEFSPPTVFDPILKLKPIYPVRTLNRVLTRLKEQPDIIKPVLIHGLSNINLPVFLSIPKTVKTVVTVHDLIPFFAKESVSSAYYWQFRTLLPRVVNRADRVICVSEWTKSSLLERFPEIEKKCFVVKNGSDFNISRQQCNPVAARDNSPNKTIKILTVGRSEPYKRHSLFVDIIRKSKQVIQGTIVTNDEGAKHLIANEKSLIDDGSLSILSNIPNQNLAAIYANHDVYVQPSRFEGFCLPAAEALWAGIPVVFQTGSAVDEVVSNGCGMPMTGSDSVENWMDAVLKLNNMRPTAEFQKNLEKHYETLTTWKDAAAAVKKLYTELLIK